MWNEEGGDGEHRVVPSEPDLVGSIPGQGVQVVHEHRLLQVLPHQLVKLMECLHVSGTDKSSACQGTFQKRFSGFFPLRGGGVPPFR